MSTAPVIGVFRIGGGGMTAPRLVTNDPDERVELIDRYLAEHPNDVMFLELKANQNAWDEFGEQDLYDMEFMRVGVNGEFGAAEYMCRKHDDFRATHNNVPTGDEPLVLYDSCVPTYFPPEYVVSRGEVRQLMVDFALHREWGDDAPWLRHDDLVR